MLLEPGLVSKYAPSDFEKLPKALVDGLLVMLRSGTRDQRVEILRLAGYLKNKSDEFTGTCLSLLGDDDPGVRGQAVWQIAMLKEPLTESSSLILRQIAQDANKPESAEIAVIQLWHKRAPGFEDFLFGTAATISNRDVAFRALVCLTGEYESNRSSDTTFEDRLLGAISREFARPADRKQFGQAIKLLLAFPLGKALPILDQAIAQAPNTEWAGGVRAAAEAIRSGTSDVHILIGLLPRD